VQHRNNISCEHKLTMNTEQTGCWPSWTYWWPESLIAIEDMQKENYQFGPLSSCSHIIMHHQNMEFFYIPCAHQVCDMENLPYEFRRLRESL